MEPITEPAIWLRHERAYRCALLMAALAARAGHGELAAESMAFALALHEVRALDRA